MKGLGTSVGIGIGKVLIYKEPEIKISKNSISDSEQEIERLNQSIHKAIIEIDNIYNITLEKVGEPEAEIFAAHKMILEDPEYISAIKEKILTDNVNSEWAVREITNSYISLFQEMEDEYLRARAVDIKDVSDRMLRILLNIETKDLSLINRETIIVARDLNPSDTAQINKDMVVGIVTEIGGSHIPYINNGKNYEYSCNMRSKRYY